MPILPLSRGILKSYGKLNENSAIVNWLPATPVQILGGYQISVVED